MSSASLKPRQIARLGWRPDTPDHRDRPLKVVAPARLAKVRAAVRNHWLWFNNNARAGGVA